MTETITTTMRRRREVEFLSRELYRQAQDLLTAIGDLVPAELAAGDGTLADGTPLGAVAGRLDELMLCFDLLQQELGLPEGTNPHFATGRGAGSGPLNTDRS